LLACAAGCADDEREPADGTGAGGAATTAVGGATSAVGGAPNSGGGGMGGDAGGSGGAPPDTGVSLGGGVTVSPTELAPGGTATIRYDGQLASSSSITLHYGFDGWNATGAAGRASEDDGTGNQDFFIDVAMSSGPDGWEASVAIPDGARAIHAVFTNGTDWDNNGGLDYNRGIRFPYIGPYLGLGDGVDAATGVTVSFVTGHACLGTVEHGPTSTLGSTAVESSPGLVHHITLEGLAADTERFYRVRCGVLGETEIHAFRTPAANADDYTFAVLGDMQDEGEAGRWSDVAAAVETLHPETAFLVVAGDLAWNDRPGLWWTFFDKGRDLLASKVLLPTAGNHDTPGVSSSPDTTSFERFFPLDGTYYRRSWGNAELIGLNSERPGELAMSGGAQYDWMQQELAATSSQWTFAFWHIPPYNAGARHWTQQGELRDLTSLFDGALDWVFCGHEHLYQRHRPLRYNGQLANDYGRGANEGVGYLIVPPAGVWPADQLIPHGDPKGYYRDRLAYPVVAAPNDTAPSELGFVAVDVTGTSITLTTYGLGTITSPQAAHVVDTASYTKP
jgi:hypothetical protein